MSYPLEDAFAHACFTRDTTNYNPTETDRFFHLRNVISREFFWNGRRFSRMNEEDAGFRKKKNLEFVFDNCPREITKYFRKLEFVELPRIEILCNCVQLADLTLGDFNEEIINSLPVTLRNLAICNAKSDISVLKNTPRNLRSLKLFNVTNKIDMSFFSKLEELVICYSRNGAIEFTNSENHSLRKLTIASNSKILNCNFPKLFFVEFHDTTQISSLNPTSLDSIEEMRLVKGDFQNECFSKMVNLRFLKVFHSFLEHDSIDISKIFPNLEEIDVSRGWGSRVFTNFFIFDYKMHKISAKLRYINEKIQSDYFFLKHDFGGDMSPITIPKNVIASKGQINFSFYTTKIDSILSFDSGNVTFNNKNPELFTLSTLNDSYTVSITSPRSMFMRDMPKPTVSGETTPPSANSVRQ